MNITYETVGLILPWEKSKIANGVEHFRRVAADPKFYEAVEEYKNRRGENKFYDCNISPQSIANFLNGRYQGLRLKIKMYQTVPKVVAYHENGILHLNRLRFYPNTLEQVAGSLAHEDCHTAGFNHSYYDSLDRPDSVPYAIGRMVAHWRCT